MKNDWARRNARIFVAGILRFSPFHLSFLHRTNVATTKRGRFEINERHILVAHSRHLLPRELSPGARTLAFFHARAAARHGRAAWSPTGQPRPLPSSLVQERAKAEFFSEVRRRWGSRAYHCEASGPTWRLLPAPRASEGPAGRPSQRRRPLLVRRRRIGLVCEAGCSL
jgi:hypothetical protein